VQQTAGLGREARVKKPFLQAACWAAHHWRWQAVQALDMGFGAQVFQVDPHGRWVLGGQGGLHSLGQLTAKCFDHPVDWRV
jgi:hypothetical protein